MSSQDLRGGTAATGAVTLSDQAHAHRPINPSLIAGGLLVVLIIGMALLSFVWTPHDPTHVDAARKLEAPSSTYWFGTDMLGRDIFSQILVGARTTLFVGIVAVGIAAVIGVPLGVLAALAPRRWGEVLMRVNDIVLAFPALLLAIMLTAAFGQSTLVAMAAIGVATVPSFVRLVRAGALQVMGTEYVLASRVAGHNTTAIGWRHVLPNVLNLVIVQASVAFAIAILAEAALSYLGFSTPPPTPSWGRMLQEGQSLLFVEPLLVIFPGIAIALAVLGFNLLGDGLRDFLDPKLEDRR